MEGLTLINEMRLMWTDAYVLEMLDRSAEDCKRAGETEPNSDWHNCCFAACVALAQEANRRGLRRPSKEGDAP